jgi:hypothetical protein
MANTALGTPYVTSSDYVTNYPTTSLALANAIDAFGGVRVYTNEAARNAGITAPFEGMVAYLTSPTVPAATGGTTYVPTGVTTVYNGSAWVCTTEVGAFTSNGGTYANAAFGATLSGSPGTNPSVTLSTGATALVTISASLSASALMSIYMDVAVSGATTIPAGTVSSQGLLWQTSMTNLANIQTATFIVSGLTAGANTFTLNYANNNTSTYASRRIIVKGIA